MVTLSVLLLGIGCKSSKNMTTLENEDESNPEMVISMKKTPCYGTCPVYEIKIFTNHKASLIAERNLPHIGEYTAIVPTEKYNELVDAFSNSSFFEFEDSYVAGITDLPTTFIYFSNQRRSKKIKDYYGSPQELKDLETMVAKLLDELQWKEETEKN